ncbi:MAG TPA: molybdopterin-binding protein [Steroidobacteraceae bacterium]|nr:molybdopterin-binding protein [Steroidobacteraceae bacterium]
MSSVTRRRWLQRTVTALGGLTMGACDRIAESPRVNSTLDWAEEVNHRVQRVLLGRKALAREYTDKDISREFRANGTTNPDTEQYNALAKGGFVDWKLAVGGLVERPLQLSLEELRSMPPRTQITRHDCVEGWSCIGKWKGVQLSRVIERAGLKPDARFIAFYCADTLELTLDGTGQYYETIDLVDALHPQTLLAYDMNDRPLDVPHGAPLRLRLERQLGYKMAKYVMRIEALESFERLGRGKGGYWEDRGYQWYAGI